MRRPLIWLCLLGCLAAAPVEASTGRVIKVLPQYLDLQGRASVSPSLYERDAYQVTLRQQPKLRSGIRIHVQWKAKGYAWDPLKLRVELRGIAQGDLPRQMVMEEPIKSGGWFGHWTAFTIKDKAYKDFGEVTAWRVTLWEGDQMLGEQQSFLW